MIEQKVVEGSIHTIVDVVGEVILHWLCGIGNRLTNDAGHGRLTSSSEDARNV